MDFSNRDWRINVGAVERAGTRSVQLHAHQLPATALIGAGGRNPDLVPLQPQRDLSALISWGCLARARPGA